MKTKTNMDIFYNAKGTDFGKIESSKLVSSNLESSANKAASLDANKAFLARATTLCGSKFINFSPLSERDSVSRVSGLFSFR